MKKMIFVATALAFSSTLISQSVIAETFQSTSNGSTTTTNPEPGRVGADPVYDANISRMEHLNKRVKVGGKKKPDTTVSSSASMKDQAPETAAAPAWLSIDNLSGTMTMASNYVFRGISQTRNLPALQGSFTYEFPVGLYLSAWGSNVKFEDTDATLELDSVLGWRGDAWNDFSYDLSVARYNYPGARELNYNEFNSVFNYKIFQLGYSYSADVFATHQFGQYYLVGVNYDIPSQYTLTIEDISIHATMGHYTLPRAAGNSYNDYSAWVCKKFKNYMFTVQWTGTNGRQHAAPIDSNQLLALLTAEF